MPAAAAAIAGVVFRAWTPFIDNLKEAEPERQHGQHFADEVIPAVGHVVFGCFQQVYPFVVFLALERPLHPADGPFNRPQDSRHHGAVQPHFLVFVIALAGSVQVA